MIEVPDEVADTPVEPLVRPRHRGRTALLIAGAVVMGLVAGTCVGYLVQADREPTKLPPLSQPVLKQAKGEVEPLSAAQDHRVKTDGDLRKLLLKKPAGAKDADWLSSTDGWMDLAGYADMYPDPDQEFGDLVSEEFRRAAQTGWDVGSTYGVEIRLIQYRQEEKPEASVAVANNQYGSDAEGGTKSWAIPGSGNGMVYVHTRPDTEPGYLPQYNAEAHAWRGDIALEIFVWDTKPIPKAKIMDLAERQMERL